VLWFFSVTILDTLLIQAPKIPASPDLPCLICQQNARYAWKLPDAPPPYFGPHTFLQYIDSPTPRFYAMWSFGHHSLETTDHDGHHSLDYVFIYIKAYRSQTLSLLTAYLCRKLYSGMAEISATTSSQYRSSYSNTDSRHSNTLPWRVIYLLQCMRQKLKSSSS